MELPTRAAHMGGYYIDAVAGESRYMTDQGIRELLRYAELGYNRLTPQDFDGNLFTGEIFKRGTRKTAKRKANRIMRRKVRVDLRCNEW